MVTQVVERKMTDRVKRLKDSLIILNRPVSNERLKFVMEAYQDTHGHSPGMVRAKLLDKVLSWMTIFIDENPIVGSQTKYRGGVQPMPEWSCKWMREEKTIFGSLGEVLVTDEDRKALQEAIDFWDGKSAIDRVKEMWNQKHPDINVDNYRRAGIWSDVVGAPMGRVCVGYEKVLNKGFEGLIADARAVMEKLPINSVEALKKRDFLSAVIIACNAVIKWAHRYAVLARDMAQKETNPQRRKELGLIAETCDWVPAKPARSFREAIQSFFFTHVVMLIERGAWGYSPGRFAEYMYPFYKKDKEEGRITEEEATELLELLYIKFTENAPMFSRVGFEQAMANLYQNISIGGVDKNGNDATNELTYLILEAQYRVRLIQPTISLLYHDRIPEDLLFKSAELVSKGIGMPAFFSNNTNIQGLMEAGWSLEDARANVILGCVERSSSHVTCSQNNSMLSIPMMLILALYNGKDPKTGKQLGAKTGDSENFQSYNKLFDAVVKQIQHCLPLLMEFEESHCAFDAQYFPHPYASALIDDCIERGLDEYSGGARYSSNGYSPVGTITTADSLAAIKKLVFEEKRINIADLKKVLEANFEGYDEIYRMCIEAPKYGNEDEYVDLIARALYLAYAEEHSKHNDWLGRRSKVNAVSVTFHMALGSRCGALPNGRKAGLPFTDGSVSASPGMDKSGPTALIRSAATVIDNVKYGGSLLNMKIHPSALKDREGFKKLLALVKTYLDLGGHHIQFNVVSADTLRDAQIHPENYRDLIVRVAGFSAYFVHLDPMVQSEIIQRTELRFS